MLKLQKLLRRAEQMLAEKKKAHKATTLTRPAPPPDQRWVSSQEMAEQAEKDTATIAGLETRIKQMAARGGLSLYTRFPRPSPLLRGARCRGAIDGPRDRPSPHEV